MFFVFFLYVDASVRRLNKNIPYAMSLILFNILVIFFPI